MTNLDIPTGALDQIVAPVLTAMFELPLTPVADHGPIPQAMAASIRVAGAWEGLLCVETTPALAGHLAQMLLALQDPPPPIDARDALAEIVNTIAGNFKSAFTPGARLGLPSIGNPWVAAPPDEAVTWLCEGNPIRVSRYSA